MTESTSERQPIYRRLLSELGILALLKSPFDVKLLCFQRFTRLFAYGASTLILVAYLQELGHSRARSGLFMTLTLVGDVLISFLLTLVADSIGRKAILSLGALLMAGSGVVFATASNFWVLLAAAVVGVISPAGNEIGPFRAIEESIVAHLTVAEERSDVYAWYNLIGAAGAASGMMTCGWAIDAAVKKLEWSLTRAYRATFVAYAVLGLVKLVLTLCLSGKVEAEGKKQAVEDHQPDERSTLLGEGNNEAQPATNNKSWVSSLLPSISTESKSVTATLCMLFALDSFGSGLAPM
jgi:MFS family permease